MEAPPLHEGLQSLGGGWSIVPPYPMGIREEGGSTVIWHAPRGLSLWINVYGADPGTSAQDTLDWIRAGRSAEAHDELTEPAAPLLRYGYRLEEGAAGCASFYGTVISPVGGYVLIGAYFEDEASFAETQAAWRSVAWKP